MTEEEQQELLRKHPYVRFWCKILDRLSFDVSHGLFHYKNLKATIWIIFFNPISALLLVILLVLIIIGGLHLIIK